MIGRSDLLLKQDAINHWKAKNIDLSKILWTPPVSDQKQNFNSSSQDHNLETVADKKLIELSNDVLTGSKSSVKISKQIGNTDRSYGAMLSGTIAKKYGFNGLNEDSIVVNLKGTAGQSFGTFYQKG